MLVNGLLNWLSQQHAPNNNGKIEIYQAEKMRVNNPTSFKGYVNQFVEQETQAHVSSFEQQHHINQSSVETAHRNNNSSVPDLNSIEANHSNYRQQVEDNSSSVDVGRGLNNDAEKRAWEILDNASKTLAKSEEAINAGGNEIKQIVTSEKP